MSERIGDMKAQLDVASIEKSQLESNLEEIRTQFESLQAEREALVESHLSVVAEKDEAAERVCAPMELSIRVTVDMLLTSLVSDVCRVGSSSRSSSSARRTH